jgi:hypothetical protein
MSTYFIYFQYVTLWYVWKENKNRIRKKERLGNIEITAWLNNQIAVWPIRISQMSTTYRAQRHMDFGKKPIWFGSFGFVSKRTFVVFIDNRLVVLNKRFGQ